MAAFLYERERVRGPSELSAGQSKPVVLPAAQPAAQGFKRFRINDCSMGTFRPRALQSIATAMLLGLTGCAGSGAVPNAAPAPAPANTRSKTVLTEFVIRVPKHRHRTRPAPAYISSSTKSVSITVDAGPRQTVLDANVTLGSPGCSTGTCTLILGLLPGHHIFDVITYDQPLKNGTPQGNVLSQNLGFPFTVQLGKPNQVGVVLQGVPANIAVAQIPDEDVTGDQQSGFTLYGGYEADGATIYPRTFNVATTDADGNYIVGDGAPLLTMTSSDSTALSNGAASTAVPNRFTVTPVPTSGFTFNMEVVRFTVTATPSQSAPSNSGSNPISIAVDMQFVAQIAPRIYVTDQQTNSPAGKLWVFDEAGKPVAGLQTALDATDFGGPVGVSYCATTQEALWVSGEFSHSLYQVDYLGRVTATVPTGKVPLGIYCYSPSFYEDPLLYVANAGDVVTIWHAVGPPNQVSTTGTWEEQTMSPAVPNTPWGILVDADGVIVTDQATKVVQQYDTNGDPVIHFDTIAAPFGITDVPGAKNPYVTERNSNAILLDYSPLPGGFPNISGPFGIRQDPANGYLYVVNYYNSTVTRYDAAGNQISLPAGAFAGPANPLEIDVAP